MSKRGTGLSAHAVNHTAIEKDPKDKRLEVHGIDKKDNLRIQQTEGIESSGDKLTDRRTLTKRIRGIDNEIGELMQENFPGEWHRITELNAGRPDPGLSQQIRSAIRPAAPDVANTAIGAAPPVDVAQAVNPMGFPGVAPAVMVGGIIMAMLAEDEDAPQVARSRTFTPPKLC
jgi:hypothetical protein